ncbi:uncharacterized protein LOC122037204 [Zingiber officinale]|uniref:uncharacterized protein LOC122037204 n=1 Tax=Zingiber officinale TaxID=94328 RepID=UPI001C4AF3BE|nr:uncharacterized protein LOC122037204 [Zingiber officinale]
MNPQDFEEDPNPAESEEYLEMDPEDFEEDPEMDPEEDAPPKEAPVNATADKLEKLEKWPDHNLQARCYILASMSNELQRRFEETVDATDIHKHLQELYGTHTCSGRHAIVKELMAARMRDEASVHEYGVKMIGVIEKLLNLDLVIPHELSTDIILMPFPSSFDNFVINFNMNKLEGCP